MSDLDFLTGDEVPAMDDVRARAEDGLAARTAANEPVVPVTDDELHLIRRDLGNSALIASREDLALREVLRKFIARIDSDAELLRATPCMAEITEGEPSPGQHCMVPYGSHSMMLHPFVGGEQAYWAISRLHDRADAAAEPLPMILHCPNCHLQHVDVDGQTGAWATSRHHRKHLCKPEDGGCGHVWQPSLRHTVGVRELPKEASQ
jgi:hypothetical protein